MVLVTLLALSFIGGCGDSGSNSGADAGHELDDCTGIAHFEQLYADSPTIAPSETTNIYAVTLTDCGTALAQGVTVRFEITSGSGGLGNLEEPVWRATTNPDGIAVVRFTSGPDSGETTIVAAFDNPEVGTATSDPLVITVEGSISNADPEIVIELASSALLADGQTETTVVATVYGWAGEPAGATALEATVNRGAIRVQEGESWERELSLMTDAGGQLGFNYRVTTEPGDDSLRLCVPAGSFSPPLDDSLCAIAAVRVFGIGSITSNGVEDVPLGISGSGMNESTPLCFDVGDTQGNAVPAGVAVEFNVTTTSSGGDVLSTEEPTDAQGVACTTVISGRTAGVISVEPCVSVGVASICGSPVDLPVSGAVPSRSGLTLSCDDVNLGALRYLVGTTITDPSAGELCTRCSLTLRDRFGNPTGFPYTVTFAAEAGWFSPAPQTVNDADGLVEVDWCADGNLPADVEPFYDEPYWADGPQLRNPRDGLVTIIAYVSGEEEFVDENENGRWEEGEVFWDLSEPFVDADDNNSFDSDLEGERFIDIESEGNQVGAFDYPNLEWDNDTFIWVQTRVQLTGGPAFGEFDDGNRHISLDLDADYDEIGSYRLSHWYVRNSDRIANIYEVDTPGPLCDGVPMQDYCMPLSWVFPSGGGVMDVFFVARDMFGSPMNASLQDLTFELSPAGCGDPARITVTDTDSLSPPGDEYPFDFQINRSGLGETASLIEAGNPRALEQLYAVEISNFVAGSSEWFTLSWDGVELDQVCRFRIVHEMSACPTCGDPVDGPPWPYMLITN